MLNVCTFAAVLSTWLLLSTKGIIDTLSNCIHYYNLCSTCKIDYLQIPNVTNSFYTQTFLLYIPFQYIYGKKPDTNKTQRTVIQKKIRLTMEDPTLATYSTYLEKMFPGRQ